YSPYRTKSASRCAPLARKSPNPSSNPSSRRTHRKELSPGPALGREPPPNTPVQTPQSAKRGFAKNTSSRNSQFRPLARGIVHFFLRGHMNSDRKSTRLNSSHRTISYAVFCL